MNQEKNINTQAAAEVMTTDEFHRQLVENTEAINKERMAYERKKIQLQQFMFVIKRKNVKKQVFAV